MDNLGVAAYNRWDKTSGGSRYENRCSRCGRRTARHLCCRDGSRNFWCRGYYVDTVGKNEKIIREYIRNQLEEDYTSDQVSLKEFRDPFTGEKRK